MKIGFLQKLIERMDRLDPGEVQTYLLKLVEEKGFLEKTFEALQEGVILLDDKSRVSYINAAACQMFGIERDRVVGTGIQQGIRGLEWQELAQSGGTVSRDFEINYPETRFLNFHVTAIDPNEPMGYVILVRDVTETRRMTEKQLESERISTLTMMAAGVAHELGNPLNSLTIHLQIMERRLKKHPAALAAVREMLDVARDEIQRLDGIITRFLRAIRPVQMQPRRTDLVALVKESVEFLDPEIRNRSITVNLETPASPVVLPLDADQMKQAFYNLIRNAIQAIGDKGEIKVSVKEEETGYAVSFRDNGPGIPDGQMNRLFQPYQTTKSKGSGLGLLIVRRIIRDHGGEMEIASTPGQGTTVVLHLPTGQKRIRALGSGTPAPGEQEPQVLDVNAEVLTPEL